MNEETIEKIISKHKLYMSMDSYEYEAITKVDLYKLIEEIERLNNNWNELEKFICDLEIECNIDSSMWGVAVIIHNKLKELKGSNDKENQ